MSANRNNALEMAQLAEDASSNQAPSALGMDPLENINQNNRILQNKPKNLKNVSQKQKNEEEEEKIELEEGEYIIDEFDDKCEKHSRIQKVVPLTKSCGKFALFIFLNIITVGIINLFVIWFPGIQLIIRYSKCDIKEATHVGIYAVEGGFFIEELVTLNLPNIEESNLKKHCFYKMGESNTMVYFKFKLFNYVFYETSKVFKAFQFNIKEKQSVIAQALSTGLTQTEMEHQKKIFGICDLIVIIPNVMQLLITEFSDPFYLFQVFSIVLWYCTKYVYYASVIVLCTIVSLSTAVYEGRINYVSIKNMARYACKVNLVRKGENGEQVVTQIMSTDLVPGDLFEIPDDGYSLPCDCLLISGTVIVNESMLTGESTPITKNHMPDVPVELDLEVESKYTLFAGTKIVQKRGQGNQKVMGVVYKIGFDTVKGNLIRSILFPKEVDQNFQSESIKYIYVMASISLIGYFVSLPFLLKSAGLTKVEMFVKFLDLITTTVPPSLPACLSVGVSYALSKLKEEKIICISRERVNIVGKIDMICFDKTGTLTEDHLDIYGFRPVIINKNKFIFDDFYQTAESYSAICYEHYKNKCQRKVKDKARDLKQFFIECLATCHGNTVVKGKMIGDPIDVKMFQACGWVLKENIDNDNQEKNDSLVLAYVRPREEPDIHQKLTEQNADSNYKKEDQIIKNHYELGIVRRFDFSSKLQRMTVLAKDSNQNYFKAFCKGSPEKVKKLCLPESVPENFSDVLNSYTVKGLRVLAMATKFIKMDFVQANSVSQDFVEKDMIFQGLLIVQNRLKKATTPSIQILDQAHQKMLMATGDNILTAISVSKECKLVHDGIQIYSCDINKEEGSDELTLTWTPVEMSDPTNEEKKSMRKNSNRAEDSQCFEDKYPPISYRENKENSSLIAKKDDGEEKQANFEEFQKLSEVIQINEAERPFKEGEEAIVAITGPSLEKLYKKKKKYVETNDPKYKTYYDTFKLILRYGIVFARMAPEHKTLLVESLREEGFNVMMCGDGANDCGALRAADVGVSLSPEEASIAAHFTSKIPDISCLITLLREGKASLVTSIQTFKYMMMYSLIQFFAVTLLMCRDSYLTDPQYLLSDVFIILPVAFFIAQTESYEYLTYDIPESSLLSFPILSSVIIHMITTFLFQFVGMIVMHNFSWFVNTCEQTVHSVYGCMDNTVSELL